jgi:DNA-directed RNA polymerase subunit H
VCVLRVLFGVLGLSRETVEVEPNHALVPKHELLSKEESERVLKELGVKIWQLPRIAQDDPAIRFKEAEVGQLVRITRRSDLVGEYAIYRYVVSPFGQKGSAEPVRAVSGSKEPPSESRKGKRSTKPKKQRDATKPKTSRRKSRKTVDAVNKE